MSLLGLAAGGAIAAAAMGFMRAEATSPQFRRIADARQRAPTPPEPLVKFKQGYFYSGSKDNEYRTYVQKRLETLASTQENATLRKLVLAFRHLCTMEGYPSSINTWDNQIFTWGVGFSGLGLLPAVMQLVEANHDAKKRLEAVGVGCPGGRWKVANLSTQRFDTGKAALRQIAKSRQVLHTFIDLARSPHTRDVVIDAQLACFLAIQKDIGDLTDLPQPLVNFAVHLRHWLPGAAGKVVRRENESDAAMAERLLTEFVGKAQKLGLRPSQRQLQTYWHRIAAEGLDVGPFPMPTAVEGIQKVIDWIDPGDYGATSETIARQWTNIKNAFEEMEQVLSKLTLSPEERAQKGRTMSRTIAALQTWALKTVGPEPLRDENYREPSKPTKMTPAQWEVARDFALAYRKFIDDGERAAAAFQTETDRARYELWNKQVNELVKRFNQVLPAVEASRQVDFQTVKAERDKRNKPDSPLLDIPWGLIGAGVVGLALLSFSKPN